MNTLYSKKFIKIDDEMRLQRSFGFQPKKKNSVKFRKFTKNSVFQTIVNYSSSQITNKPKRNAYRMSVYRPILSITYYRIHVRHRDRAIFMRFGTFAVLVAGIHNSSYSHNIRIIELSVFVIVCELIYSPCNRLLAAFNLILRMVSLSWTFFLIHSLQPNYMCSICFECAWATDQSENDESVVNLGLSGKNQTKSQFKWTPLIDNQLNWNCIVCWFKPFLRIHWNREPVFPH